MSTELLSENENQAAEATEQGRSARSRHSGQPVPYDFRRPHRVSKERLRTLEAMYERLVKSLEGWLLGRVRGPLELELTGVEQLGFGEFALSLPTPCNSYLVDIQDSGGQQGVIDFGQSFACFLVDRLLGGNGAPTIVERALTPIERMVVRTVADRTSSLLREVWEDYIEMTLAVSGFESIPEILRATGGDNAVLVANVRVKVMEHESNLALCLPFAVLDKFFADSALHRRNTVTGSEYERELTRRLTESGLRQTRVPVTARLPELRISMRALNSLQPGAVLETGIPRDAKVTIAVSGQPRFEGSAARIGRKMAVSVTGGVTSDALAEVAAEPGNALIPLNVEAGDLT